MSIFLDRSSINFYYSGSETDIMAEIETKTGTGVETEIVVMIKVERGDVQLHCKLML